MQQLNLIDTRLLPARHLLSGARLLTLGAIGLTLALAHLVFANQQLAQTLAAAGMAPQTDLSEAVAEQDPDAALQARIVQRQALRDMLAKADQLPRDSAAMLGSIIAALPDAVWLTEIDMRGTSGVRIAGGASQPAALRSFAERLASVDALRGMPIETLRLEPQEAETSDEQAAPASHRFVLASAQYMALESDR